jgi:molybdopterin converting factor small subunit
MTEKDIEVQVKVAGILRRKAVPPLKSRDVTLSLEPGATVSDVIARLGVARSLVGSVTVNKKRSPDDLALENGDVIAIIPAISGG